MLRRLRILVLAVAVGTGIGTPSAEAAQLERIWIENFLGLDVALWGGTEGDDLACGHDVCGR